MGGGGGNVFIPNLEHPSRRGPAPRLPLSPVQRWEPRGLPAAGLPVTTSSRAALMCSLEKVTLFGLSLLLLAPGLALGGGCVKVQFVLCFFFSWVSVIL